MAFRAALIYGAQADGSAFACRQLAPLGSVHRAACALFGGFWRFLWCWWGGQGGLMSFPLVEMSACGSKGGGDAGGAASPPVSALTVRRALPTGGHDQRLGCIQRRKDRP